MLPSTLMQPHSSTMSLLSDGSGGRLQSLIAGFESRVHLLALYTYQALCDLSPFPFEVTVVLVIFTYITVRQLTFWYHFDLKPHTKGYVYWHMSDLIDIEYRESYKPEHHLTSAMIVYVTQKLWREAPLTAAELKNKAFTIHLLSLHSKSVDKILEEWDSDEDLTFRDHEELMLPVKLPIYPCWTPVHEGGVEMCTWITTTRIKNCYPEAHRYIYLRVRKEDATAEAGARADAALRRFVDSAVAFYFAEGYGDRDDRSLRTYRVTPTGSRIFVKASPLPLAPTFDTVFFPQRAAVRLQLQRFLEMKGRYAIKGFPRKLGYLLYGPRGTGKRSFVRALAYHTKRHIVRVPLSTYTKNAQLYSTFHFEEAMWGSTEEWNMLSSKKVIFLIEDVDTTSDLVCARGKAHTAYIRPSRGLTTRDAQSACDKEVAASHVIHTADKVNSGGSRSTTEEGAEEDALTTTATHSTSRTPRAAAASAKSTATEKKKAQRPAAGQRGWELLYAQEDAQLDAVDLSTLLNVLDGAVEEPERIVVMIADHPERLDPALLRPGRLATHIRFDFIELDDLVHLCGLFYGTDCLAVKGTLRNDGAVLPIASMPSGKCEYACVATASDSSEAALKFPHENVASGAGQRFQGPEQQHQLEAAPELKRSDDALLDWQRREFESSETAKLEERVIRQLSATQAAQVRACIAALEKECALGSGGSITGDDGGYNFMVTPAHVHHMCMRAPTLDAFLTALTAFIRREGYE